LALWLGYLERPSLPRWAALAVVSTSLYFTHIIGFAFAFLILTAYTVLSQPLKRVAVAWSFFLPASVLFVSLRLQGRISHYATFQSLREKLGWLWSSLRGLPGWRNQPLDIVFLILVLVCLWLALWKNTELRINRSWLGAAIVLFGTYWILPLSYGQGYDVDVRVLPFLFFVLLASIRLGKRARYVAAIVVVLSLLRVEDVTHHFVAEQTLLADWARSLDAVPANARVLPMTETDQHSATHFWGYGIIRKGWLSPYLFSTYVPLELRENIYAPEGIWTTRYRESTDWERVRALYDYVWAYRMREFSCQLNSIGDSIFSDGNITVYRMKKGSVSRSEVSRENCQRRKWNWP
jgi:hypothetical protein